jgi:hypothetical protein
VEGAADEVHVDPVETAAVPQQDVVDLCSRAQFFDLH